MSPSVYLQRTSLDQKGSFCGLLIRPLVWELRKGTSSSLCADTHHSISHVSNTWDKGLWQLCHVSTSVWFRIARFFSSILFQFSAGSTTCQDLAFSVASAFLFPALTLIFTIAVLSVSSDNKTNGREVGGSGSLTNQEVHLEKLDLFDH